MHCANQVNNRDYYGILFPSRQTFAFCTICQPWHTSWTLLVSTCERLSVMHQPARLPENFDQISPKHPCSGILHRTPLPPWKWKTLTFFAEFTSELTVNTPPENENSNFLSWVQIWAYPEHPPPKKMKTLTFFPEFTSELTQNTSPPKMKNSNFLSWVQIWAYLEHPPPKWKTLTFFPQFRSELTQNTPPKMKNSNFLSWVQIWAYLEHPPPQKWKTLTFFLSSDLSLPRTHPPSPEMKTLTFFLEFRSELTPPNENSNFLSWVHIWAYQEHPPKMKTLTFFPEFRSELTQNTPPQMKTLTFFPEFTSELTQNTSPLKMKNSNFLSWVQIWAYLEHPPPKMKNSHFLSSVQIWAYPEHTPQNEKL